MAFYPETAIVAMTAKATQQELMLAFACLNRNREFAVRLCEKFVKNCPLYENLSHESGKEQLIEFLTLMNHICHHRFVDWDDVSPIPKALEELTAT